MRDMIMTVASATSSSVQLPATSTGLRGRRLAAPYQFVAPGELCPQPGTAVLPVAAAVTSAAAGMGLVARDKRSPQVRNIADMNFADTNTPWAAVVPVDHSTSVLAQHHSGTRALSPPV